MASATSTNDWGEWSKYVLKEIERLNDELKELRKSINELNIAVANGSSASDALLDKISETSTRINTIVTNLTTLETTVTSLRITLAEKVAIGIYGGIGGGVITGILKLVELALKR